MRRRPACGAATATTVLLCCLGASAGASAHEFTATKLGMGTIAGGLQTIHVAGGTIECAAVAEPIEAAVYSTEVLAADGLEYQRCNGFGIKLMPFVLPYEWHANGTWSVTGAVAVTAREGEAICKIVIPAQYGLTSIEYSNVGVGIEMSVKVSGLESEGSGSLATCKYATEASGTVQGSYFEEVPGATLRWV